MTIDKLLHGIRSLMLSGVLAYSACGGSEDDCRVNSDCDPRQTCERDPDSGEMYCANPGEGEAEGEGNPDWWYDGMCDDVLALLQQGKETSKNVFETLDMSCRNYCEEKMTLLTACGRVYCTLEHYDPIEYPDIVYFHLHDEGYEQCQHDLGIFSQDKP